MAINVSAAGIACGLGVVAFRTFDGGPLLTSLLSLVSYLAICQTSWYKKSYPPGPKGWPIIRNLLQIPQNNSWLVYSAWAETYGDVVHLEALSDHIVILNTVDVAKDLLDGRSTIYSDRPESTMAELSGFSIEMPMQPYNDEWRRQRRVMAQSFNPGMIQRYWPVQEDEARKLVYGILKSPDTLVGQTKTCVAAIILRVTYGYPVKGEDDPMITLPFEGMENFSVATEPGAWMVDFVPLLRYLPRWMPGASFLRIAERFKDIEYRASWSPYLWCKQKVEEGSAEPSLVATALSQSEGPLNKEDEFSLVWGAASGLGGGLDTNMSTIFTFVLAMLHHPHIQAKAQDELDRVVGQERLPSISDRPSLPYLRSVITEVLRWYPATPLGLPHALRQDDVYKDWLIPKSSIIIPNVWRMTHDPRVYTKPDEFIPERFEGNDVEMRKLTELVFGFGRRTCPGSQFAEGSLFAIAATILATCVIVPKLDAQGNPILPAMEYTSGIIVFPKDIICDVKPRSSHTEELLESYLSNGE